MAAGEVRLMAEGRMVEWEDLVNLADGATVQVLGNMRGGMGRSPRKIGEEPVGIGWVGSSILGTRSSLVGWQLGRRTV